MMYQGNANMKRIVLSLVLVLAVSAGASAQSWKNILGKVANEVSSTEAGSAVTNVLGALLGTSLTLSDEAIAGTWSYEGVACVLESESALTNIGGSVVASTLEGKIDEALSKVGIEKGECSFCFEEGGKCSINVGGYDLQGKYELDAAEKVIVFTFMYDKLPVKTFVAYEVQNLNVVFEADKVLEMIKGMASYLSENAVGEQLGQLQAVAQAVGTMGALLQNYDGMMLGVKLTRVESVANEATTTNVAEAATTATEATTGAGTSTGGKVLKGLGKLLK